MDKIYYKKQVQKLVEQIGTLQTIDLEKHQYFSEKATKVMEGVSKGDYIPLLELETEMIDFLTNRVKSNQIKNLPVPIKKPSLISRIRELFSSKNTKSEISKIAEQIVVPETEPSKGQFIPDKRTVVYDFFKNNISTGLKKETKQTFQYTNVAGDKRTFDIVCDELGTYKFVIGETKILPNTRIVYEFIDGYEVNTMNEYLNLIRYDKFINSKIGNKTFINAFGREMEKAAKGCDPDEVLESIKAGERLDKLLKKNSVYMQMKESFDKTYKEYKETVTEFRQSEESRRESFNRKNLFKEELNVKENTIGIGKDTSKQKEKIREGKEQVGDENIDKFER